MKVVIINKSDATGGAAVVSTRLLEALNETGADARMLVAEKVKDSPRVELAASRLQIKRAFLTERLDIFRALRFNRENLFKVDTAACGLPLSRHLWVREADVVCLGWVNQGMLSLREIRRIAEAGKPIIWTMHDMWNMTGVCHHAGTCDRFTGQCGDCPLMGAGASPTDLSHKTWSGKRELYSKAPIRYVAVSNWLKRRATDSSLLSDADVRVIPNPFRLPETPLVERKGDKCVVLAGAARLDDPIKGLPFLIEACNLIADTPEGSKFELHTFGAVKNPDVWKGLRMRHRDLGYLANPSAVREAYERAHIVVSSSLYETLPGTLVEGQAYGCVPVSFDRGGQSDIVEHGKTGYIAHLDAESGTSARNLADGIIWANRNRNPQMLNDMRRSVREKFSSEAVARAYLELFEEALRR